jgi:hypothetical protein
VDSFGDHGQHNVGQLGFLQDGLDADVVAPPFFVELKLLKDAAEGLVVEDEHHFIELYSGLGGGYLLTSGMASSLPISKCSKSGWRGGY